MNHPLETYLRDLRDFRSTGAAVPETSYYPPLANLLSAIGQELKPRVRCVMNIANRGAGIPDGGLFTEDQFQRGQEPLPGAPPARGAIEVKPTSNDALATASGAQVTRYWNAYGQVLVKGVTAGKLRPEIKGLGSVAAVDGGQLDPAGGDLALTAGWGHLANGAIMPARGRIEERDYTVAELAAIEQGAGALGLTLADALALLGEKTCDVYLNARACWRNVPRNVWTYTIGGYQVIKKWLSYREEKVLGRALHPEEAREVTAMVRRLGALCLLQPTLDANYCAVKCASWHPKNDRAKLFSSCNRR